MSQLMSLRSLYDEFHPAGLDVVGVAMNSNDRTVRTMLDDTAMDWHMVSDQTGLARSLNIGGAAKTFILDENRNVLSTDLHGAELTALVRKILQK